MPRRIGFTLDMVRVGTDRLVNQTMLLVHNRGLTAWWELENQQIADAESAEARETAVRWTMRSSAQPRQRRSPRRTTRRPSSTARRPRP